MAKPSSPPAEPDHAPASDDTSAGSAAPRSRRSSRRSGQAKPSQDDSLDKLSFAEAQAALELCLAQLQATDLAVESMAELYQRALAYAERCEAVLEAVENQVMQWDPAQPDQAPRPLPS